MNRTGLIIAAFLLFLLPGEWARGQKKHAATPASGQNKQAPDVYHAAIRVLAKAYGDSIVIRWAPTKPWAWSALNVVGYTVERIEISAPGTPRTLLTVQPIRPLTLDQFKAGFAQNDKYAAIAAQCLYGTNFTTGIRKGYAGQGDKASVFADRYGFALQVADYSGRVAKAEALRWTDTHVQRGAVYAYIVYPGAPPTQGKIDTGGIIIPDSVVRGARPTLSELIPGDHIAEIHWNRYQKDAYSGFYIDRSDDGQHFQTVNALPFYSAAPDSSLVKRDTVHARQYALLQTKQVFEDSLPRNYQRYFFRIRGINPFGETSDYSDTLSVMGLDLTAPAPPIVGKPKYLGGRSFQLSWKRTGKETDFAGWMVTRSRQVGGPYTNISPALLPAAQTSFTDTGAYAHGQTYYIIAAVDTSGNMGVSIAAMALTPDTIPPGRPAGLKGRIDRKGRVFLSWNRNTEEDMKGYKIYYANGPDHPYSQISSAPDADTVFVDSIGLKTLTRYVWYEVVAVDLNNNHSKYSAPLRLKRPDIVPPSPPVAAGVQVDSAGAHIRWIRSYSDDVVNYILFRRQGDTVWKSLARMPQDTLKKEFHFTDSTMKPFTTYQYCAEAVDEDSLHSVKSVAVTAAVNTAPPLPSLRTLTAAYDGRSGRVNLKWQFKGQGSYYFILYRGTGAGALSRFHTASQNTTAYADTPLAPASAGGQIRYAIQVLFKDGQGKTRVSEPVAVNIPSAN